VSELTSHLAATLSSSEFKTEIYNSKSHQNTCKHSHFVSTMSVNGCKIITSHDRERETNCNLKQLVHRCQRVRN